MGEEGSMFLDGLKILEIGEAVSSAYCCKLLADLGADVIKVEKPDGDELRNCGPYWGNIVDKEKSIPFLYLNTNKKSIILDILTESGADRFKNLLSEYDIVVSSVRQSDLSKVKLDYESLITINPQLVFTSVLPYGNMEEYDHIKAYDINVSAMSGISMVLGEANREPLNFPYCMLVAGASAAGATMTAVLAREEENRGRLVDVSEIEVMSDLIYDISIGTAWGMDKPFKRVGHRAAQYLYSWTMLPVKDGYVTITFLGAKSNEWWNSFLEILGNPEWSKNERYHDLDAMAGYSDEVDALLKEAMSGFTKDEIFNLCIAKGLPLATVCNPREAIENPHYRENRNFIREVFRGDLGTMIIPGMPYEAVGSDFQWKAAPLLGEHNTAVLGYLPDYHEHHSPDRRDET